MTTIDTVAARFDCMGRHRGLIERSGKTYGVFLASARA